MDLSIGSGYKKIIGIVSVIVPLLVAFLIFFPEKLDLPIHIVSVLPHLNGLLNSITSVLLIIALIMVRSGKIVAHRNIMLSCIALGTLFLISYVLYHASAPSTVFGDLNHDGVLDASEKSIIGSTRTMYVILLLTHILLAAIVLPLVLLSLYRALTEDYEKHKKMVRYAFPIWLFVSISGVVVYLMIRPYYNF
ncbi:MAG: DUF420 domain-containing protein [Bacteroidota bacterium]